jgi:nucleoside-diphosphate-sugar epimerase
MRVLVTGSKGFIGVHLINELEAQGHSVFPTDRDYRDFAVPGQATNVIDEAAPDYVIHLAARYGRILCRDEPHRAVSDNAAATTELAAACAAEDIPVLYASSSEVYGDHGEDRIYEDSELRTPTTIYGLSKRWGEEALKLYLTPEQLTIVRLNMAYGPQQRGGYGCCALATFIRNALEGEPLNVHVGASRSWLYISDLVRGMASLIGKPGVWNLANVHERVSMVETARLVTEAVGQGTIHQTQAPAGQIKHKVYDTSKIEALGWRPDVPLREGIAYTVEAARANPIRDYALAA